MEPTSLPTHEVAAGALLRKARLRRGWSCRHLAALLDMDHSELSRIERGRATSLERYDLIARALGLALVIRFRPATQRAA
jgi:transcriptional regulator with XRE-family HTH domain